MIRRDILLADGVPRWLLVSQLEHARLSWLLAERCIARFGAALGADRASLEVVRAELLEAVHRHDDGWAAWETRPRLDAQLRRPLSFRELPLDEALVNWDGSIASAAEAGPLAAWVVAGHFVALLKHAEHQHDPRLAESWLVRTDAARREWLAAWQARQSGLPTSKLADEALHWLQAFDLLSLWLCAVCPAAGEIAAHQTDGFDLVVSQSLELRLRLPGHDGPLHDGVVLVNPWPMDVAELSLEATAQVVPVLEYRDSAQLLAACEPHRLRWTLSPGGR